LQELVSEIQGAPAEAAPPLPAPDIEPTIEEPSVFELPTEERFGLETAAEEPSVFELPTKERFALQPTALEPVTEPAPGLEQEPEEDDFEWLAELGVTDALSEEEQESAELPDQAAETEAALEPTPEEELPEWLLELRDQVPSESQAAAAPESAKPEGAFEREFLTALPEPEPAGAFLSDAGLDSGEEEPEQELPSWLQELEATPELEVSAEPDGGIETAEAPDWLAEPAEEPLSTVTVDEMPDWLGQLQSTEPQTAVAPSAAAPEPEAETGVGEVGDMEWLQELEKAPTVTAKPAPEPVLEQTESLGTPPADEFDLEAIPVETSAKPPADVPLVQEEPALGSGTPDDFVLQYEALLARGPVQDDLIAELEEAVETHPDHSGLQRVLGDAYMRSDQLEQALAAYRAALRKL
jgi:hypothetical protein